MARNIGASKVLMLVIVDYTFGLSLYLVSLRGVRVVARLLVDMVCIGLT